jgi:hypothetical protein
LFITRAAADRERAHAEGLPLLDFAVEATDLIDGITGFLQAPVSEATRSALASVKGPASSARRVSGGHGA